MEIVFKTIHSYWAYLVLLIVILATLNAIYGTISKREYEPKDFRISLIALIVTHTQFLIALPLYFLSGKILWFSDIPIKDIMKNPELRLYHVEHPTVMIIAIALLTIGYSKHKKKRVSAPKFKVLAIFYSLSLIAILSRIPWSNWM